MTVEEYLLSRHLNAKTVERYRHVLKQFMSWLGEESLNAEEVCYSDLLGYISHHKEQGRAIHYLSQQLTVIRHYYSYLKYTGKIVSSPAGGLCLRGRMSTVPHDLLSAEQLEDLYASYGGHGLSGERNKAMLGLLIYQGLAAVELEKLRPDHLRLREGKIQVPGTEKINERILKLEGVQLLDLQEYVSNTREVLFKIRGKESANLFVSTGKGSSLSSSLEKLMQSLRKQSEYFRNAQQLRQSRIVLWSKQHDVRMVQYMCGHKYVSSTERYAKLDFEDLHKELVKHHPGSK